MARNNTTRTEETCITCVNDCEYAGLASNRTCPKHTSLNPYDNRDKCGEWERVRGVVTPGGDPCFVCPFCHNPNSEHLGGIEMPARWNYCPNCGAELIGDGHLTYWTKE